jgi:hypothetical protein
MIIFAVLAFVGIKLYSQQKISPTASTQAAAANSNNAVSASGIAPAVMPASPAPPPSIGNVASSQPTAPSSDDGDDGAMSDTAQAVQSSFMGNEPSVGPQSGDFDSNETQSSSGADNAASNMWRMNTKNNGGINRILDRIWSECLDVDYVSAQPGVAFYYQPPGVSRQDWNPNLNNQPWARNRSFTMTDPTSSFETEDDGETPAIENSDNGGEDE